MKGACQHEAKADGEKTAEQLWQAQLMCKDERAGHKAAGDESHHGEHGHRILEARRVNRADERRRQASQKAQRHEERCKWPETPPMCAVRPKRVAHDVC